MITQWHQLEDWIRDYGIVKWTISRSDPTRKSGDSPSWDRIVDTSNFKEAGLEQKLEITKRTLEIYGDRCYIQGYGSDGSNRPTMWNEICLSSASPQQPTIGMVPQPTAGTVDEATLAERIRKELQVEFDRREYERERKEFERERKEFESAKNSTLGAIVGYLQPYLPTLTAALGRKSVAGLDAPHDVEAERIESTNEEPEENVFTDEEAETLMNLMERFKKVEPENYLKLLSRMVEMAEAGDGTYTMAKQFLLK